MNIELSEVQYKELVDYLNSKVENVAFLFAEKQNTSDLWKVKEIRKLKEADYLYQSWQGVELNENVRPQIIQHAHVKNYMIIEAHAHMGFKRPAVFSPTDITGLREIVPHMLWRLPKKPYVALVFSEDDFDGLAWREKDQPISIDGISIDNVYLKPTGLSVEYMDKGFYDE